jgi:hypothetical protein
MSLPRDLSLDDLMSLLFCSITLVAVRASLSGAQVWLEPLREQADGLEVRRVNVNRRTATESEWKQLCMSLFSSFSEC